MSAITRRRAAQNGVPDKPAVGLAGWKFAAPQPVILKERSLLPRMKDLNREAIPGTLPPGGHPTLSQPGPVRARFSRGWVEIGVGLSDITPIHPTLA